MKPVCNGATLLCTCGVVQSTLVIPPLGVVYDLLSAAAVITDCVPLVNIPPFGACLSPLNSNPSVGLGAACVPSFLGLWTNVAPSIIVVMLPILDQSATLTCAYGGIVQIQDPGQKTMGFSPLSIIAGGGAGGGASGGGQSS